MLSQPAGPRRVLMTLDAMGGVWRYALDLALEPSELYSLAPATGP